ncbi:MAG: hypothetical protein IKE73_00400 [Bacilli bacterium]|nr:hypothetical protein [Bacilli bacterium]
MLLKKEYQIGNMAKYEQELKNCINELKNKLTEEETFTIINKCDFYSGEDLSNEDKIKRIKSIKESLKTIKEVKKNWTLNDESYLINPEIDNRLENELIRANLVDSDGYLFSYSDEKKALTKELENKDEKNKKRTIKFSCLFGALGISLGIGASILGYDMHTVNQGKKYIYEEIDKVRDDFDIYRNGNGELHALYEEKQYDDASKAIEIFASDMRDKGFTNAEIAVYLRDAVHNGSIGYYYLDDTLNVDRKEMKNACKIKYHEEKALKLKKGE